MLGKKKSHKSSSSSFGTPGFPWGFLGHGAILEFCLECCCFQGFRELTPTRCCSWEGLGMCCALPKLSLNSSKLSKCGLLDYRSFLHGFVGFVLFPRAANRERRECGICAPNSEKQGGNSLPKKILWRDWNGMMLRIPSNPKHSKILKKCKLKGKNPGSWVICLHAKGFSFVSKTYFQHFLKSPLYTSGNFCLIQVFLSNSLFSMLRVDGGMDIPTPGSGLEMFVPQCELWGHEGKNFNLSQTDPLDN